MHDALHAASRRVTSGWGERVREERGSRYASKKRLYDRDLNLAPRYDFMILPQIAECRPPPGPGLTRVGLHTGQGEESCSSRTVRGRIAPRSSC
jgi:hypothetical protein